jgi:hypothetical protein
LQQRLRVHLPGVRVLVIGLPAEPAQREPALARRRDVHRQRLDVLVSRRRLKKTQGLVRAPVVDPVEVDDVEVHVQIQRGAEALN